MKETSRLIEDAQAKFHKAESKLESLKNIAERYDGYGNSIRKIMEQKAGNPGILGVVSDLIQVDKKYETAIETALSGNIQNIVTEDEATAKKMISYLKQNHFGRATFLPLTSVKANRNPKNEAALGEKGVLGIANRLVKCEPKYDEVVAYLLGRVIVVDTIDNAIALAKKNHYSLHIVTVEGEYLAPGGSMTGGAFRNSSNLLARNREIEELEKIVADTKSQLEELRNRKDEIATAIALGSDELAEIREKLQKKYIEQNTARLNVERADQQRRESESAYDGLRKENEEIEIQLSEINQGKKQTAELLERSKQREAELEEAGKKHSEVLEQNNRSEQEASDKVAAISLESADISKTLEFVTENIERINSEIEKFDAERDEIIANASLAKEDISKKQNDIEEIRKTLNASESSNAELDVKLKECLEKKEQMSAEYKGFFTKQEEVSKHQAELDKEIFRLNNQKEKLMDAD